MEGAQQSFGVAWALIGSFHKAGSSEPAHHCDAGLDRSAVAETTLKASPPSLSSSCTRLARCLHLQPQHLALLGAMQHADTQHIQLATIHVFVPAKYRLRKPAPQKHQRYAGRLSPAHSAAALHHHGLVLCMMHCDGSCFTVALSGAVVGTGHANSTHAPTCLQIPPGCSRYTVQLKKPLGLVLEQNNTGNIYVVRGTSCSCRTRRHPAAVFTIERSAGLG